MHKARCVLDAGGIGGRVGTVQGQMEPEIGEFLFQLQEVVQVEHLVEGACAVEEVHDAVRGM